MNCLTYLSVKHQLEVDKEFKVLFNVKQHKYEMLKDISLDCSSYKSLSNLRIEHEYYAFKNGIITAKKGYRYDGPSGPTKDDETNMRAALFHDIIYQAFTETSEIKQLSFFKRMGIRRAGDKIFRQVLKTDGMGFFRRNYYFVAVRGFGALFAYF